MLCLHCQTSKPIKIICKGFCGGVHTARRQTLAQIPFGFCTQFNTLSPCPFTGHYQCKRTTSRTRNEELWTWSVSFRDKLFLCALIIFAWMILWLNFPWLNKWCKILTNWSIVEFVAALNEQSCSKISSPTNKLPFMFLIYFNSITIFLIYILA